MITLGFSPQTWAAAILEMEWLGPIIDLKPIWFLSFFTAAITGYIKLPGHQKLDKIIFQQYEH